VPYLTDRGRQYYREWLAMPTPKAFAISQTGFFYSTSGLKPKDTTLPTDPTLPPVDVPPVPTEPPVDVPTDPTVPPVDVPTDPTLPPVDVPTDPTVPPVDVPPTEPPVDVPPTPPVDVPPAEPTPTPMDVTGVITFDVSEAPVATHFALRALPGATAGETTRFAVVPLDESNEPVANFTGTVAFTSSDPDAVLPADYTFTEADQGVHVFAAEFKTAGNFTLTATAADGTTTGEVTVQVSEPTGELVRLPWFSAFRPRWFGV